MDHVIRKFNLNIQINHKLAYLRYRVIFELTKNAGCTMNKAGALSNFHY